MASFAHIMEVFDAGQVNLEVVCDWKDGEEC
jgi:hypothetical protein